MTQDLMWVGEVFALMAADPAMAAALPVFAAGCYDAAPLNLFKPVALAK